MRKNGGNPMSWITAPLKAMAGWVNKSPGDDYWYSDRSETSQAGVEVSEQTAMTFATVFACVGKLSKTTATLPLHVYQKTGDNRTKIDHWLPDILTVGVRETLKANQLLWGNAYARETWTNGRDRLVAIEPLPSQYVTVKQNTETGELVYEYIPESGDKEVLTEDNVLHLHGLSLDGMTGLSPIAYNRQAVGLGMAATTFGESFFGNGAWFGGLITNAPNNPKNFSKEAAQAFLKDLEGKFKGSSKAFGWGLLRGDMEFKQLDMPFEDAMFLQTRQFQRTEICSIFDVPPSLIQDNERSTFSNSEQQDLAYAKHSILPLCVRDEAALNARYLPQQNQYVKHNLAGLMRGDFETRMKGYAIGRQWGIWSINDIREMEDLNPIANGGDEYLVPLNMRPAGQPAVVDVPAITAAFVSAIKEGSTDVT